MGDGCRYIFVTGGVVSSLGKGIAAASLGTVLENRNLEISMIKMDPYINVDPGTMSPFQHGEVYVTSDGAETDLDLGHYERFVRSNISASSNYTAGRIYENVIRKERKGDYIGATVQVIPHITDEIKSCIRLGAGRAPIAIVEIGGTVGDIESLPFLEAIRQMRIELGPTKTIFIHVTLVPHLATVSEIKTKPTQHSVKELRSIGIQPDILLCRATAPIAPTERRKIALFTNVEERAVISAQDVESIYEIPLNLNKEGLDDIVIEKLGLQAESADLSSWSKVVDGLKNHESTIKVAMVGKYVNLTEAYKSLTEALIHAGLQTRTKIEIAYLDAEAIESNCDKELYNVDAVLVPGGFGERGIPGKIHAVRYAREQKIPFLGICLGMQIAVIEIARNIALLEKANSTEFDPSTPHPVIAMITEWQDPAGKKQVRTSSDNLGGTMRLGSQTCKLVSDSLISEAYSKNIIEERHRHRYEFNNYYTKLLNEAGLKVVGKSVDDSLVEVVELLDHPWFVGCQFHPEFTSTPRDGHPLFSSFINAAKNRKESRND